MYARKSRGKAASRSRVALELCRAHVECLRKFDASQFDLARSKDLSVAGCKGHFEDVSRWPSVRDSVPQLSTV